MPLRLYHLTPYYRPRLTGYNNPQFIPQLIDLHRQGKFPVERICKVYPVAELEKAIADMEAGTVRGTCLVKLNAANEI